MKKVCLLFACMHILVLCHGQARNLDPTFGNGGLVINSTAKEFIAIAAQTDGKIVAGGESPGNTNNFVLARYLASGSLDNSFGVNGVITFPLVTGQVIFSIAIQNDGKIVLAGYR